VQRYRRAKRSAFAAGTVALKRLVFLIMLVSLALVLWGMVNLFHAYSLVKANIEQIVNIELPQGSQATRIYARDYDPQKHSGTLLGSVYVENRQQASYQEIPPVLIACVLSTEDKNFFQHGGVDLPGTARAVFKGALRHRGSSIRGTSTITQQLSRNVFLPFIRSQRTLNRKIQEMILAGALERRFAKWEILEAYLNHTYFGAHAYGVRSAALTYFGKDLGQLTLAECAMLAGLPQSPSKYNPYTNPEGALARRDAVLQLLDTRIDTQFFDNLRRGDSDKFAHLSITHDEIEKALSENVKLSKTRSSKLLHAEYFVNYLSNQVLFKQFGPESVVGSQGLTVVSTIDPQYQAWAEEIIAAEIDKDRKAKRVSQGALVLLEARTGSVLACAGGYRWGSPGKDGQPDELNRALQCSRQVGSAFKPFTYSTAYEQGFDPSTLINDAPENTVNGKPWPRNSDGTYRGWMSMYYALQWSRNAAAVDVITHLTGIPPVIDTARKMGLNGDLPEVPALTLGVADIHPIEMAEAFATFPNMGQHVKSVLIRQVYNDGGILIENNDSPGAIKQRANPAFSQNTAWIMVQNMMRVVNAGTGTAARVPGVEIAGKTGTCDDFRDAWFIGYSPELVCAVWVGNDDYSQPMNHMFGGQLPARIFNALMKRIYTKQTQKSGVGKNAVETVAYAPRYTKVKFEKPAGATFSGFRGGSAGSTTAGEGAEAQAQSDQQNGQGGGQGSEKPPKDDSGFYEPYQPPPDNHVYF
jgi:penicillin-binding protein 1A